MKYRLVTVWIDPEEMNRNFTQQSCRDFASTQEIDEHIAHVQSTGIMRADLTTQPMDNGARLVSVFVPIDRITGHYVWELPDDAPPWPIVEAAQ